ncbi:urease accessory protein UreF [Aurantivibrio plasticivorans]
MTSNATSASLVHLMHLVSPALPVGAYAYSQGFESAVEFGWVHDAGSTEDWLRNVMQYNIAQLDAPVLMRLYDAWQSDDVRQVIYWNDFILASRETKELLLEDSQMGQALWRLLKELDIDGAKKWQPSTTSFTSMFALAASHYTVAKESCIEGFVWSWLENQMQAAIKLVPLGQTQANQLLVNLIPEIPGLCLQAAAIDDAAVGNSSPRIAVASMQHETQYSRLFRS